MLAFRSRRAARFVSKKSFSFATNTVREREWNLDRLEEREVMTASPAGLTATMFASEVQVAQPFAQHGKRIAEPMFDSSGTVSPAVTPMGNVYYNPSQIRQAYGFNSIKFGSILGTGAGQTIAIVDAYDNPNIANDLAVFDAKFGIKAPPAFTKVSQTGSTTKLPRADAGWASEIALDVEWAHALAPDAKILLVEANSTSYADMFAAVNYARNAAGVSVVSMSWGGPEFSTETTYDSYLTTPTGHQGVTFVVSTGDSGAPACYPAASPKVLAVGGTSLRLDTSNNYTSEVGWSLGGGGISKYESQPAFQKGIVGQSRTMRTNPDVSFDADPSTGVIVYDSYNGGKNGYYVFGGTSFSAPAWGALIAIADQGRALAGKTSLDGATGTLPAIYSLPATDFHDVTSGNNGYGASVGYDLVTGRGSPYADRVARDLANYKTAAPQSPTATGINQSQSTIFVVANSSVQSTDTSSASNQFLTVNESTKKSIDAVFETYRSSDQKTTLSRSVSPTLLASAMTRSLRR